MLTDIAPKNHLNRPRPPGSRRTSAAKVDSAKMASPSEVVAGASKENDASLQHTVSRSSTSSASPTGRHSRTDVVRMEMERDLELDLPFDFTAALDNSSRYRLRARKSIKRDANSREKSFDSSSHEGAKLPSIKGGSLRRLSSSSSSQEHAQTSGLSADRQSSPSLEALSSLFRPDHSIGEHRDANEDDRSSTESGNESEHSIDAEWVGNLPREELEVLLMQANQVIKERERDLGIAAAIGKALLEKNISLRSKHEGILTRLNSVNSFPQFFNDDESLAYTLPQYSPPTMNIDADDDLQDETPRPQCAVASNYFDEEGDISNSSRGSGAIFMAGAKTRVADSPSRDSVIATTSRSSSLRDGYLPTTSFSSASASYRDKEQFDSEVNSRNNCFVASYPPTPESKRRLGSQERSLAQIQFTNETQRQLDMLSEQNETLLEQLALLQQEAEEAKKAGGRRLKNLNWEIDGLRGELEAATERNNELEHSKVANENSAWAKDVEVGEKEKRTWKRRGLKWKKGGAASFSPMGSAASEVADTSSEVRKTPSNGSRSIHSRGVSISDSVSAKSESSLSTTSQSKPERALVAQLMAKIRELEETNALLAITGTEIDGRIGKAMEEGERIRDAYEGLENVTVLNSEWEGGRMSGKDSSHLEGLSESILASANISPFIARKRRAPGNRYSIAGRQALRVALESQHNFHAGQDEGEYESESSSHFESPVKGRTKRRSSQPRIFITPSCDDLRTTAKGEVASHGRLWNDDSSEIVQHRKEARGEKRGDEESILAAGRHWNGQPSFTTPEHPYEQSSHRYDERRTLGSELGGFNDEHDPSDEPMGKIALPPRSSSLNSVVLGSRASLNSVKAASEADSDIADLKWSVNSDSTTTGQEARHLCEAAHSNTRDHLAAVLTGSDLTVMGSTSHHEDLTCDTNSQDNIPRGFLRNDIESSHDSYERIENMTRKLPLHWADDDDFGRPITEREARSLGLLEESSGRPVRRRGLLDWMQEKAGVRSKREVGKARKPKLIESLEELHERETLEGLLREKRVIALRNRVASGQISMNRAREKGVVREEEFHRRSLSRKLDVTLEKEIDVRALAYSAARTRKMHLQQQALRRDLELDQPKERRQKKDQHIEEVPDEQFELLDLDPSKRRPGRSGTDYHSLTARERYKPRVVKQRVNQISSEAITWASAWATFSLVMVFAFLVAFSRGPKRVLNGQKT
ncbi:hypothetical protein CBS101457_001816 [Exobasidium rhododendri]|nr:hypothetical protein CBS101457_001816 [Exobasidium rhododendri]